MRNNFLKQNQKYVLATFMLAALFSTYSFNFHSPVQHAEYASTGEREDTVNLGGKTYKFKATEWKTTVKEGEASKEVVKVDIKFTEGSYCDNCTSNLSIEGKSLNDISDIKVAILEGYTKFLAEAKKEEVKSEDSKEESDDRYPKAIADKIDSCSSKDGASASQCYINAFVELSRKMKTKVGPRNQSNMNFGITEEKLKEFYHEYISPSIKSTLESASSSEDKEAYGDTLDEARDLTSLAKISGPFKDEIRKDIKQIVKDTYKDYIREKRESVLAIAKDYQSEYNSGIRQYNETVQMCRSGMVDSWDCQDRLDVISELNEELFEKRSTLVDTFDSTFSAVRSSTSPAEYFNPGSQTLYQNEFFNPMTKAQINLRLDPAGMYIPLSQAQLLSPQDSLNSLGQSNTSRYFTSRVRDGLEGERFMMNLQRQQNPNFLGSQNQQVSLFSQRDDFVNGGVNQNFLGHQNINQNWGVHNSLVRPTSLSPSMRNNFPTMWQGF